MKLMLGLSIALTVPSLAFPSLAQSKAFEDPPPGELEAGGLAPPLPPEPSDPFQPQTGTEAGLEAADREDSGKGLQFFWLNGEIGVQHLGLQTLEANDLVDAEVVKTKQTGLMYGAGLGVRLVFLTLGARFRLGNFEEWQLWTLDAEAGLRIPIDIVEPYFTFALGYASLGSISPDLTQQPEVDVKGFNVRGGFGVDVFVVENLSLGGNVSGNLLFLQRPKVDVPEEVPEEARQVYEADGSSIGAGVSLTAVVGLHF